MKIVMRYDRSSTSSSVNEARLDLFVRKQRSYMAIPPTQASLKQHTKRAVYQGGIIWGQTMNARPCLPSPANYGWFEQNGKWEIHWTDLPPIAQSCQELTKCGCKKGCSGRCKCYCYGLYPVLHFVVAHVKTCKYRQSFVLIHLSKTYHR